MKGTELASNQEIASEGHVPDDTSGSSRFAVKSDLLQSCPKTQGQTLYQFSFFVLREMDVDHSSAVVTTRLVSDISSIKLLFQLAVLAIEAKFLIYINMLEISPLYYQTSSNTHR